MGLETWQSGMGTSTGGDRTLRLTSPQAPRVEPMALMTLEKTVFRSCFRTPCSW